jgi:hypothetical protein
VPELRRRHPPHRLHHRPGTDQENLEAIGEPLEPPPLPPARGPPIHWPELVQAHDDRDVVQAAPDGFSVIVIHAI